MGFGKKKFLFEAIQFIPVIAFAISFIVKGEVNLDRAAVLFIVSAILAVLITSLVIYVKGRLNPILLGTNIWLCIGALAFGIPFSQIAELVANLKAAGLFACVLGTGLILTFTSRSGFIGMEHANRALVRNLSVLLLFLTFGALLWSWYNTDDIRLGGGLPFILLNILRRFLTRVKAR